LFCFIFYENNYNFVVRALLFYTISLGKKITWINEKKKKVLTCLLIVKSKKIKLIMGESWTQKPWECRAKLWCISLFLMHHA